MKGCLAAHSSPMNSKGIWGESRLMAASMRTACNGTSWVNLSPQQAEQ